jgi:hypothetical protein
MDTVLHLAWLAAAFLAMFALGRWIDRHVQSLAYLVSGSQAAAVWALFLLFAPGTFLHELSHLAMALALGVPTGRFVVWPMPGEDGGLRLGSVEVAQTDLIRSSLIGVAPLVAGTAATGLIGSLLGLDALGGALAGGRWAAAWQALGALASSPAAWPWVYLVFVVAYRMLPSPADRKPFAPVLVFLAVLSAIVLAAGWLPVADLQNAAGKAARLLAYPFTVAVVVGVLVALLIALAEGAAGMLRRRSSRQVEVRRL